MVADILKKWEENQNKTHNQKQVDNSLSKNQAPVS